MRLDARSGCLCESGRDQRNRARISNLGTAALSETCAPQKPGSVAALAQMLDLIAESRRARRAASAQADAGA
eukprot:7288155-Pyramimonas_sp.AAC.1